MKNIAFYISNHGFGHAARNITIIKALLNQEDINIIIKSGKEQLKFINQYLEEHSERVALLQNNLDVGLILKSGALTVDEVALKVSLIKYINSWDNRIEKEVIFLREYKVDLVVSDIVPWVFKASSKLNIKSLLISNFTWVEIYKEYFDDYICNKYLECYKLVDKAFLYGLYNDKLKNYFKSYDYVGLSCRNFNIEKVQAIQESFDKPIVFVSVGRSVEMSKDIKVDGLPYNFIVTEGIKLIGKNVHYLPRDVKDTQDYIMASSFIITKAGWGTVAEALCAGTPMAVIARDFIEEDRVTAKKLKDMKMAIKISEDSLYNIEEVIEKVELFDYNTKNYKFNDDSENIARKIIQFLRGECSG